MNKSLLCFLFFALFIVSSTIVRADKDFTIIETLRDSKAEGFTFGGSEYSSYPEKIAYLTSGIDDSTGDGWLRLTRDQFEQSGYAVVNKAFPTGLGVLIDLEFKIWRINDDNGYNGADGFSIFLFDASTKKFHIGGFGGSLGYAPHVREGNIGLSDGYVGIGIDEFGNYCNPTEGRTLGKGFYPNNVSVRGPSPKYEWLGGNLSLPFNLQFGKTTKRPDDSEYYRRIRIEIKPRQTIEGIKYDISVNLANSKNGKFYTILSSYQLPSLPPDSLKLGFAASTGNGINFHELRNLYITTPGGVRIKKEVDKSVADIGDSLTYTLNLYNETDTVLSGLKLNDLFSQLPSQFEVSNVSFNNCGDTVNKATNYSVTDMSNVSVTLDDKTNAIFTIKGIINAYPPGGLITNTAIFNKGTANIYDTNNSNDTSTVTTVVLRDVPRAIDDTARTKPNTEVTIYILKNDIPKKSPIAPETVEIVDQPTHGSVIVNLDGTVEYTPNVEFSEVDTFTYFVKDTKGDSSNIATVRVTIPIADFFIPNVFTPNGDGVNDVFEIVGLEYFPNSIFKAFSRWGDEVYSNNDYHNEWDGAGLNEGTYMCQIILKREGKVKHNITKWVLLKRSQKK